MMYRELEFLIPADKKFREIQFPKRTIQKKYQEKNPNGR